MYPLIVTAACTGMRRGDVCGLRWSAVDLAGGMLAVKTSKTEAEVEIPIFAPLRAVLESRKGKGTQYVFPEAAAMLRENANGLTWRFKKILAHAFAGVPAPALPPVAATEIEAECVATIAAKLPPSERRNRILDTFKRYAAGESVRQIETATGQPRATVSADLHAVQTITGKSFMRGGQAGPNTKADVARITRTERKHGQRAASIWDWHTLRATWVTLALAAGVPVELVRRVTGHATVEIVLQHYFRPDREQFRAALAAAMPGVLTGTTNKPAKVKPADELAALAGKLAAGTATKDEKKRLRILAARV